MKEILFIILLTFAYGSYYDISDFYDLLELPIKCDDNTPFEGDYVAAFHVYNETSDEKEILVNGKTCDIYKSINNKALYCSKYGMQNIKKKLRKRGDSCLIDSDCIDAREGRDTSYSVHCVKGKCMDYCSNRCGKDEKCAYIDFRSEYDCSKKLKEGDNCELSGYECGYGLTCQQYYDEGQDKWRKKCIKLFSLDDDVLLCNNSYATDIRCPSPISQGECRECKSGYRYKKIENIKDENGIITDTYDTYRCGTIQSQIPCTPDDPAQPDINVKSYLTSKGENQTVYCYKNDDGKYYPEEIKAKYDYMETISRIYQKINVKKINKDLYKKGLDYFLNKDYRKADFIYKYFMKLYNKKIINENGEIEKDKEKCFNFYYDYYIKN